MIFSINIFLELEDRGGEAVNGGAVLGETTVFWDLKIGGRIGGGGGERRGAIGRYWGGGGGRLYHIYIAHFFKFGLKLSPLCRVSIQGQWLLN